MATHNTAGSADGQATLDAFRAGTTTEQITRTVCVKLETSQRKNERVRRCIDEWQAMAARAADLLPSHIPHRWGASRGSESPWLSDLAQREFPLSEIALRAHERNQAFYKVSEAFGTWCENGQRGERPSFGDKSFMRFCGCCDGVSVAENGRGYGIKIKLEPFNPEWFHATIGAHQREWLDAIVSEDATAGSVELHFDGGDLYAHLSVSTTVDVYKPGDISRWVGVDLGERVLYAAAVVDGEDVVDVAMETGREFRHHRTRIDHERDRAQERGDKAAISGERRRYTNHVTHEASRAIVDLAVKHHPAGIRLEDLTGYCEGAADPIHDWPYAELREKITYKATDEGVPVEPVNPRNSSITCRKCGHEAVNNRHEDSFHCRGCSYDVHADVNAAVNHAFGGVHG